MHICRTASPAPEKRGLVKEKEFTGNSRERIGSSRYVQGTASRKITVPNY